MHLRDFFAYTNKSVAEIDMHPDADALFQAIDRAWEGSISIPKRSLARYFENRQCSYTHVCMISLFTLVHGSLPCGIKVSVAPRIFMSCIHQKLLRVAWQRSYSEIASVLDRETAQGT